MRLLKILLLATPLCVAYAEVKDRRCKFHNGVCTSNEVVREDRCQRLPYSCPKGSICCRRRMRGSVRSKGQIKKTNTKEKEEKPGSVRGKKRKCRKRKPCRAQNGICVPAKNNDCTTGTNGSLCKGKSCTCCLNSIVIKPCKRSPNCENVGGSCIKKVTSSSCDGTLKNRLCRGKKCTCCLPRKCQCGIPNVARVVGGEVVSPQNKYPWMVGLLAESIVEEIYFCGGTIINDRYILTAGHCLYHPLTLRMLSPEVIQIGLADHNQASTADDVEGVTTRVEVEELIPGDNYNISELDHDIALIKLKEPLDLNAYPEIKPVCLPADDSKTYEGEDGIATGWGSTDFSAGVVPDELMEVSIPILSPECKGELQDGIEITENMLCAGKKKGGKDTCTGDSGGPLVVNEDGTHVLVGIVSFGNGCGYPNTPGVYTRVTRYLEWIKEKTSDGNYCSKSEDM